jgi:hypothetical protein
VRIDTAQKQDEDYHPVSYMCLETGVGSGAVYYEHRMFDTEEAALAFAQLYSRRTERKARADSAGSSRG